MLKTSFFNWHYYQYLLFFLFFFKYICIYLYNVPLTVDVVVQ